MNSRLNNWSYKCEEELNKQINLEFTASYFYDALYIYFSQSSVGLNNIATFFKKSADEEREHAHKLIDYQNTRGGQVELTTISPYVFDLKNSNENDILYSFKEALNKEQSIYENLKKLHNTASEEGDAAFSDFIEGEFLKEQLDTNYELSQYISQLLRINNDGHGLWNFDKQLST